MGSPLLPEYSLPGAIERATLLNLLAGNQSKYNMDLVAADYVGQALTASFFKANDGTIPCYYWCTYGTNLLVIMLGINSASQGLALLRGYTGSTSANEPFDANGFFVNYAVDVFNNIPAMAPPPINITIIGHSAGGSSSFILSNYLFSRWSTIALTKIVTFGAPKSLMRSTTTNYDVWAHSTSCSWMNFDDPAPLMPPTTLTWTPQYGTGQGGQLTRVRAFIPPQKGKICQTNLSISDGNVPPGVICPTTVDFGLWFYVLGTAADGPHAIRTYMIRLINAQYLANIPQAPPTPTPVPPPPPPATPSAVAAAFAAERATYTVQEGRNNAQIRTYPAGVLFETVKQGDTYKVAFGGVVVAVGPGKKTAQGLTRAGNDLIKRLQGQGGVDSEELVQQFITLITLATDPTSGVVPNIAPI